MEGVVTETPAERKRRKDREYWHEWKKRNPDYWKKWAEKNPTALKRTRYRCALRRGTIGTAGRLWLIADARKLTVDELLAQLEQENRENRLWRTGGDREQEPIDN